MKKICVSSLVIPYLVVLFVIHLIGSILFFIFPTFYWLLTSILFVLSIFFIYCFRMPEISLTNKAKTILCPCDGSVSSTNTTAIEINSKILDKFVKYSPVDGRVINIVFFLEQNVPSGGSIELTIEDENKLQITILIRPKSFLGYKSKISCLVENKSFIQKGTPIFFAPWGSYTKISFNNKDIQILPKAKDKVHAYLSHLCI